MEETFFIWRVTAIELAAEKRRDVRASNLRAVTARTVGSLVADNVMMMFQSWFFLWREEAMHAQKVRGVTVLSTRLQQSLARRHADAGHLFSLVADLREGGHAQMAFTEWRLTVRFFQEGQWQAQIQRSLLLHEVERLRRGRSLQGATRLVDALFELMLTRTSFVAWASVWQTASSRGAVLRGASHVIGRSEDQHKSMLAQAVAFGWRAEVKPTKMRRSHHACMDAIDELLHTRFFLLSTREVFVAWAHGAAIARLQTGEDTRQALTEAHSQRLEERERELEQWKIKTEAWAQSLRHSHEVSVRLLRRLLASQVDTEAHHSMMRGCFDAWRAELGLVGVRVASRRAIDQRADRVRGRADRSSEDELQNTRLAAELAEIREAAQGVGDLEARLRQSVAQVLEHRRYAASDLDSDANAPVHERFVRPTSFSADADALRSGWSGR